MYPVSLSRESQYFVSEVSLYAIEFLAEKLLIAYCSLTQVHHLKFLANETGVHLP